MLRRMSVRSFLIHRLSAEAKRFLNASRWEEPTPGSWIRLKKSQPSGASELSVLRWFSLYRFYVKIPRFILSRIFRTSKDQPLPKATSCVLMNEKNALKCGERDSSKLKRLFDLNTKWIEFRDWFRRFSIYDLLHFQPFQMY